MSKKKEPSRKSSVKDQLYQLLEEQIPSLDLISALAGDRRLSPGEKSMVDELEKQHGNKLYSDILFALTHQSYPPGLARQLWDEILRHKKNMSGILGRNIGIAAATLDYLTNVRDSLESPTLISQPQITTIAEVALKDELTQLYDSSTFHAKLETEINRYRRYGTEFSLIMLDIDDFKKVNDMHGHQEGNRVLREISSIILKMTRGLDICARYGGEEFAIILPQTGAEKASSFSERLRKRIARNLKQWKVTISIGVASCPKDASTSASLIKKSDSALYRSKRSGKNCVTVC